MTGFQLKRQILRYQSDTNHVLLYNNQRIDKKVSLITQVPDFASVILCAAALLEMSTFVTNNCSQINRILLIF